MKSMIKTIKTISELNSKWWYRLLKVVFFLAILGYITFSISLGYHLNSSDTLSSDPYVLCDDGTKLSLEIPLSELNDGYTVSQEDDAQYKTFCSAFLGTATQDSKNYTFYDGYVSTNWFRVIGFSFFFALIFIIFSEILRRLFYYIVLGSFRPPKE